MVSVRSFFVLAYIRGIIPLASFFNTLHVDLIFLICCDCCLHFICLVQFSPLFWFLSHFYSLPKAKQNPSFLWHFLPFLPYLFLSPLTQFIREVTKAACWAVPLLSGDCQTCTGERSSAFEILFRTDCCFCKSLYMVKILVWSFGEKKSTSEKWKATQTGENKQSNQPKRQLSARKTGRMIFNVCVVASDFSLPFSWTNSSGDVTSAPPTCVAALWPGSRCPQGAVWHPQGCRLGPTGPSGTWLADEAEGESEPEWRKANTKCLKSTQGSWLKMREWYPKRQEKESVCSQSKKVTPVARCSGGRRFEGLVS